MVKTVRVVLFFVSIGLLFPLVCSDDPFNFLLSGGDDSDYKSESDDGSMAASGRHSYGPGMNDDPEDRQPDDDVLVIPTIGFDPKRSHDDDGIQPAKRNSSGKKVTWHRSDGKPLPPQLRTKAQLRFDRAQRRSTVLERVQTKGNQVRTYDGVVLEYMLLDDGTVIRNDFLDNKDKHLAIGSVHEYEREYELSENGLPSPEQKKKNISASGFAKRYGTFFDQSLRDIYAEEDSKAFKEKQINLILLYYDLLMQPLFEDFLLRYTGIKSDQLSEDALRDLIRDERLLEQENFKKVIDAYFEERLPGIETAIYPKELGEKLQKDKS